MLQKQASEQAPRVSRRGALRAGVAAGAASAGLVGGATVGVAPAGAQAAAWRTMRLELIDVVGTPVSILRAGSGPPQRGDWFHVDAQIYASGQTDRPPIGLYQCFGAWTNAGTDAEAFDQRFTSVQFRLDGRGAIMGIINEGGADPAAHVGAVQGGTGEFAGALGTFQQLLVSGGVPGVTPGQAVFRAVFDLILPNVGAAARAPAQVPRGSQDSQEKAGE
jgi:hypothetical protein